MERQVEGWISYRPKKSVIPGSESRGHFLSRRDAHIPDVLSKVTNSNAIKAAFAVKVLLHLSCGRWTILRRTIALCTNVIRVFFFEEWLIAEQERQAMRRAELERRKNRP